MSAHRGTVTVVFALRAAVYPPFSVPGLPLLVGNDDPPVRVQLQGDCLGRDDAECESMPVCIVFELSCFWEKNDNKARETAGPT